MSCGQIALNRLGIKYDNYYASEIDKYAIEVTQANYPETIQLGSVEFITKQLFGENKIDLIMGGSPCQGFSFAGKQLNFDDPRSLLFFEFVRLVKELKPKCFMLENVKMKKEYQDIITKYMGVEPISINSALVSAQNRQRLYWTNISNVSQPKDKGVLLKDILEEKGVCGALRGRSFDKDGNKTNWKDGEHKQVLEVRKDGKTNSLTSVTKDNVIVSTKPNQVNPSKKAAAKQPYMQDRVFDERGKSHALTAAFASRTNVATDIMWRKLTPLECERLQTVPDNYTDHVSKTQRYKMLGNGWTVDVICHILKNLPL